MKLISLFLLIGVMQVNAKVFSQNGIVKFEANKLTVEQVFDDISSQLGYDIFYSEDKLNVARVIEFSKTENEVKEVLEKVLDGKFKYQFIENTIIIMPREHQLPNNVEQNKKVIKGKVTDINGKPLPGVTIMLKGTNIGVATDVEGKFEIAIPKMGETLIFSFIGMVTKEVVVTKEVINVQLKEETKELEDVVVIGYGTAKKKDLTGSVSRLGEIEMADAPMGASIQSMLQGRAPGVNVMISSASPTSDVSVIIRGASSLSGDGQPLWVIDGVPQYTSGTSGSVNNTLYNLNLNDVASIDILKDASATAIYGSRAANGVVIVTTKKGKGGMSPVIEYSTRYGVQKMDANDFRVLTADEYIALSKAAAREGYMTVGSCDYFVRKYVDRPRVYAMNNSQIDLESLTDDFFLDDAYHNGNTDWWNLMTQSASTTQHNLSLRGGSENSSYYASFFTKDQVGVVKGSDSKTYGGRFNFESSIRKVLNMGINVDASTRTSNNKENLISKLLGMRPDIPAYNEDGTINTIDYYTENPLITHQNRYESYGKNLSASLFLEWEIIKNLRLRSTGTVTYAHTKSDRFDKRGYDGDTNERTLSEGESCVSVLENTLSYLKNFDDHEIVVLGGFSVEKTRYEGLAATGKDFPDEEILIDLGSAANRYSMSSSDVGNSLVSAFTRLNYKYKNRYLFTATFRADGSSKFGPDKRWGYFPSGAIAWIVTEEDFMKSISDILPYLKVRFSMGKSGSQNLGNYDWRTLMGSTTYNGKPGMIPDGIGNSALQWESQTQVDLGMDFGLWKERIRGSFGLYKKKVDNLLFDQPIPTSSSFSQVTQNVGSISNKGIEFDVTVDLYRSKDITWDFEFNISKNIGVLEKVNDVDEYFGGWANGYFKINEGDRLGQFYGYKDAGRLFQNMEEIIAIRSIDPKTGLQKKYRDDYERPGDVYIMDLDGDGEITVDDRTNLGNANPDFFGGFGSTFTWKGFRINATFNYSYGNKRLWEDEKSKAGDINVFNRSNRVLESWTMNPGSDFPRVTYYGRGGNNIFCDRYLHDASFLRLSSLNLNYRLPKRLLGNGILDAIEFTFQASNLFTLTSYPGMDPQGNFSTSNIALYGMGVDYSTYPQAKTFNMGIKFTFK